MIFTEKEQEFGQEPVFRSLFWRYVRREPVCPVLNTPEEFPVRWAEEL